MKKFLALFASFGLIATTAPSVISCAKALPGQYDPLANAQYDKHKNLVLSSNQLAYLTFLEAADYLRPDSPWESPNDTDPDAPIIPEWVKDIPVHWNNPNDFFQWKTKGCVTTVYLNHSTENSTTPIGTISSKGNLETFNIQGMTSMPIMINQSKYDEISEALTEDKLKEMFSGIIDV